LSPVLFTLMSQYELTHAQRNENCLTFVLHEN
jgi:hypothetical protein